MRREHEARGRSSVRRALAVGLVVLAGTAACGGDDDGWGGYGNSSPTGTYLTPAGGLDGRGYRVLDEACEEVDDPAYLQRFETPMFRGAAVRGKVTFAVDGSLLWAVDATDPAAPVRRSLVRLPGHPIRAAMTADGTLLVAAGEAGLLAVDVTDATDPQVVATVPLPGPALDVAEQGGLAYVATGREGLQVVDLRRSGGPALAGKAPLRGFAVAVALEGDRAYVAGCQTLAVVDVSAPDDASVLGTVWVPLGHAKGVAVEDGLVFVAGGEALIAYDAREATAIAWKGWYAEPGVEGFYVNGVVARDGVAYLAAGDESVRAVDAADLDTRPGVRAPLVQEGETEPPLLDGPEVLPDPEMGTLAIQSRDPIAVALDGDRLLVLGNFRWVGERTLRILDVSVRGQLVDLGAYVQPADPAGIARHGDRVLVHDAAGEARVVPETADGTPLPPLRLGAPVVRAVERPSGLYLLTRDGAVRRWSAADPLELLVDPGLGLTDLAVLELDGGEEALLAASRVLGGIVALWIPPPGEGPAWEIDQLPVDDAFLGEARLLVHRGRLHAYDPVMGVLRTIALEAGYRLVPVAATRVGPCEAYDLGDRYTGRSAMRARLISDGERLHLFCPEDAEGRTSLRALRLDHHGFPHPEGSLSLPGRFLADLLVTDGRVTTLEFDNGRYVTTLRFPDGNGQATLSWDGHGTGLLAHLRQLLVTDGDRGLLAVRRALGGPAVVPWPTPGKEAQP